MKIVKQQQQQISSADEQKWETDNNSCCVLTFCSGRDDLSYVTESLMIFLKST